MKIQNLLEAPTNPNDPFGFGDLEGDLDADMAKGPEPEPIAPYEDCAKCQGKGYKMFGSFNNPRKMQCFGCNGTGKVKPGKAKRTAAFKKGLETKAANLKAKQDAWAAANPEEYKWIQAKAPTFGFAAAMSTALADFGSLTDNQMSTVKRLAAQDKERTAQRQSEQMKNSAQLGDGAQKILDALKKAFESGVSRPRIRTGEIDFSLAPPGGKNPGNVYIKFNGDYIGKITPDGTFVPTRDCPPEVKAKVIEVAQDPLAAAVAHGKRTGQCSCCGRRLDNQVSIDLGIGPICRAKYF